jgi:hypothetical protein
MQNTKMTKRSAGLWGLLKLGRLYVVRFEKQRQAMDEVIDRRFATAPVVSGKDAQGKNFTGAECFS